MICMLIVIILFHSIVTEECSPCESVTDYDDDTDEQ